MSYTANGMLATLKDAENNLTTYEYDGHDRLAKTRFPLPTKGANASSTTDFEQPSYDPNGNVVSLRNRANQTIAFTYDKLDRQTLKNLPGAEPDVTYTYDNLDRLTSAGQSGHNLTFTWDALGRNLTQAGPQGTVASQWDAAGRRTRLTYPGSGLYLTYDHLVTGEVTRIRENGATSGVGVLASYAFDNLGRRTGLTLGNGVSQAFTYDPVSRLASLTNNLSGTANDLSATFAWNPASQIASTVRTGDAYAFTGHVTQNTSATANGLNQLTAYGTKSLSHDAKGNVTAFGTDTFTYSSENLLLAGPGSTNLTYDPVMRLYQASGATTERFAYDGLDRIAEYSGLDLLQRRYVHGPGMDEPIVWYEGSTTADRRFLSSDERGSIIAVTNSSGGLLGINAYDEYGQPAAGNMGAWGYTGQAWLPGIAAWYYKARVYEPEFGRFYQTDPIGYGPSPNLYAYALNDPVNLVDPLGLQSEGESDEMDEAIVVRACQNGGDLIPAPWGGYWCFNAFAEFDSFDLMAGDFGRIPGQPLERLDAAAPSEPDPCNAPLPDGSTINRNVDLARNEVKKFESLRQSGDPRGLGFYFGVSTWIARVQPHGIWDYKRFGGTETQGNMNYGATGSVFFRLDVLLRGAGAVQEDPRNQLPGTPFDRPPSSYGDDPKDIEDIKRGAAQCRGTGK